MPSTPCAMKASAIKVSAMRAGVTEVDRGVRVPCRRFGLGSLHALQAGLLCALQVGRKVVWW